MCCYTTVAAAAAAVRHRVPDDKFCSRGLLHLIPVISFSSFKHDFFNEPLGSTVAFFSVDFTYNTHHTSSVLRACAEPRRALARRGGVPLV